MANAPLSSSSSFPSFFFSSLIIFFFSGIHACICPSFSSSIPDSGKLFHHRSSTECFSPLSSVSSKEFYAVCCLVNLPTNGSASKSSLIKLVSKIRNLNRKSLLLTAGEPLSEKKTAGEPQNLPLRLNIWVRYELRIKYMGLPLVSPG